MQKLYPIILLSIFLLIACEDKVKKYDGFTQIEMEYLLAGDDAKAWELIGRTSESTDLILNDCDLNNYLIFLAGDDGNPKPLLYAYNPAICDSLDFCTLHPDFCESNETLCSDNAEFCSNLQEGMLYIGSWYAKAPFIKNERSDTLIFNINNKKESIQVLAINAEYASFLYKSRRDENGEAITESYQYLQPESE